MPRIRLIQLLLLLLLIIQVPVFLQMTLTPDAVLYDLQARMLLDGGILYQDIVEPNLPGVVWVHTLLRTLFGWSPLVLRLFDLAVVAGISMLSGRLLSRHGRIPSDSPAIPVSLRSTDRTSFSGPESPGSESCLRQETTWSLALVILAFYLSTSEWCHCQRDTWMLLPCLSAVAVRLDRFGGTRDAFCRRRTVSGSAFTEGLLWGIAFWLKPFVAVPAIFVIVGSTLTAGAYRHRGRDFACVVLGGITAGLMGILWMKYNGCWSAFVTMMMDWNGDYYQAGRSRWSLERLTAHAQRFFPWILLHIPAIGLTIRSFRNVRRQTTPVVSEITTEKESTEHGSRPDLQGPFGPRSLTARSIHWLYAGWIVQAVLFQQLFDYIHVPGLILAIVVTAQALGAEATGGSTESTTLKISDLSWRWSFPSVALIGMTLVLPVTGLVHSNRLRCWVDCVAALAGDPIEAETRDAISRTPFPRWAELSPMLEYLEHVSPGRNRLMAYSGNLIHIYPSLRLTPPTRFVYLDALARCFPSRHSEMLTAVQEAEVDYVLADLVEDGWNGSLPDRSLLPAEFRGNRQYLPFPWNQTPVFRSGRYVLFQVTCPPGKLSRDYQPLSRFSERQVSEVTHDIERLRSRR